MIPDLTVLWVIFFVLLCTVVLNTLVFQPVLRVTAARAQAVKESRELAERAAREATDAAATFDRTLTTARAEVYAQMDQARQQALDTRATALATARAQAQSEIAEAVSRVQRQTADARAALDRDAEHMASAIVSRVLGRSA